MAPFLYVAFFYLLMKDLRLCNSNENYEGYFNSLEMEIIVIIIILYSIAISKVLCFNYLPFAINAALILGKSSLLTIIDRVQLILGSHQMGTSALILCSSIFVYRRLVYVDQMLYRILESVGWLLRVSPNTSNFRTENSF